jgi:hypothetical protein
MTSVAELTRQMDDERRDLSRNLSELKTRAESAFDWRDQVQRHPALVTAAALAAGMLLAQLGRSRPRAAVMNHGQGLATREPSAPREQGYPRSPGLFDTVGDTLKATAATAVAGMLAEFIPGFRDEHERRRR